MNLFMTNLLNAYLMGDVWTNIGKGMNSLRSNVTKIAWATFAVAVVIAGVLWIVGGQTAQMAKSTLGRVIIGVALVALATAIITSLASMLGGKASYDFKTAVNPVTEILKAHLLR